VAEATIDGNESLEAVVLSRQQFSVGLLDSRATLCIEVTVSANQIGD
jgi:hypothetical protein